MTDTVPVVPLTGVRPAVESATVRGADGHDHAGVPS